MDENILKDLSICHGLLGNAHIYNRLYRLTELKPFYDSSKYWYSKVIEMFINTNFSPDTFKTWHDKDDFHTELGIHRGLTGMGLSLLSSISDIEPRWDRVIFLS